MQSETLLKIGGLLHKKVWVRFSRAVATKKEKKNYEGGEEELLIHHLTVYLRLHTLIDASDSTSWNSWDFASLPKVWPRTSSNSSGGVVLVVVIEDVDPCFVDASISPPEVAVAEKEKRQANKWRLVRTALEYQLKSIKLNTEVSVTIRIFTSSSLGDLGLISTSFESMGLGDNLQITRFEVSPEQKRRCKAIVDSFLSPSYRYKLLLSALRNTNLLTAEDEDEDVKASTRSLLSVFPETEQEPRFEGWIPRHLMLYLLHHSDQLFDIETLRRGHEEVARGLKLTLPLERVKAVYHTRDFAPEPNQDDDWRDFFPEGCKSLKECIEDDDNIMVTNQCFFCLLSIFYSFNSITTVTNSSLTSHSRMQ